MNMMRVAFIIVYDLFYTVTSAIDSYYSLFHSNMYVQHIHYAGGGIPNLMRPYFLL